MKKSILISSNLPYQMINIHVIRKKESNQKKQKSNNHVLKFGNHTLMLKTGLHNSRSTEKKVNMYMYVTINMKNNTSVNEHVYYQHPITSRILIRNDKDIKMLCMKDTISLLNS